MTEAIIASSHPAEKDEALKPPSEHQNLVRRTIAGARPVLPDHSSRRTKMLMAQKLWKDAGPIAGTLVTRYPLV